MEAKFQSSFIPKGSVATTAGIPTSTFSRPAPKRGAVGVVATLIFVVALTLSIGVFAYKWYLNSQIATLNTDLEAARASIEPDTINDLLSLNSRIASTKSLLSSHVVLSPLFDRLEQITVQSVRFSDLNYSSVGGSLSQSASGPTLSLRGQARGYAPLAQQSDIFGASSDFKNTVFSDLSLDTKGNVGFAVATQVDPSLLSYDKTAKGLPAAPTSVINTSVATSTATTTRAVTATTTKPVTSSTTPR